MSKYQELKKEWNTKDFEGIEYVFGQEQWHDYLQRHNLTEEQAKATLVGDGYGGVGTREAFANREKYLDEWIERVKTECTPEEIFTYEYNNYECAYTYDYSDALKIVHRYFPKYQPGKRLLNKLYKGCNLNY